MKLGRPNMDKLFREADDLMRSKKYDEALALCDKYLFFDKSWKKSLRFSKALCYFRMGKVDEGIAVFDRRLLFKPDDFFILGMKMFKLFRFKRFEEAEKIGKKLIKLAKKNENNIRLSEAYYFNGFSYFCKKDTDKAIPYFKKALSLNPPKMIKKSIEDLLKRSYEKDFMFGS